MPNHVTNEIIFRSINAETKALILAAVIGKDGVDFSILVPVPVNIWWGSVSSKHSVFNQNELDWSTQNWGTKWNAYQCRPVQLTDDSLTLCFDTAWRPPYPWLAAIFNSLKVSFEHNSFDEGHERAKHGVFDYAETQKSGFAEPWKEEPASDEIHKRLHVLKWGCEEFPPEEES